MYEVNDISVLYEKLNNEQRGITSSLNNSLRMRFNRPFGPGDLQVSSELRTDSTSYCVTITVSSTELVIYGIKSGIIALL